VTALNLRLAKLEERSGAKRGVVGRFICVIGGGSHTEDELWTFLNTQGVEQQPGDMIIEHSMFRPGKDGPVATDQPLALRDILDSRRTHEQALGML
jgi:hypothetical protein